MGRVNRGAYQLKSSDRGDWGSQTLVRVLIHDICKLPPPRKPRAGSFVLPSFSTALVELRIRRHDCERVSDRCPERGSRGLLMAEKSSDSRRIRVENLLSEEDDPQHNESQEIRSPGERVHPRISEQQTDARVHFSQKRKSPEQGAPERPQIPCTLCERRFTNDSNLRRHVRQIHEGRKPYGCQYCEYQCSNSSDLAKHTRRRHRDVEEKLPKIDEER
uniref:C2H2-type domain-containing protein n=1 Tax=Compsopogon caeruleus TaxID=31354 RepID=A0A7S1T7N3_9RHOD|mmetsp:Transcript_12491/g.25409  ORF Transcript_12491/g.25409 Transcript_12491/m.25409 type:complete len:218 (+) Transcript_12491:259-912(+)